MSAKHSEIMLKIVLMPIGLNDKSSEDGDSTPQQPTTCSVNVSGRDQSEIKGMIKNYALVAIRQARDQKQNIKL